MFDTGNPRLDAVLEAGPRVFNPMYATEDVREEIARTKALNWFKMYLLTQAQEQCALAKEAIRQTGRENREIEWKATDGLGVPYCRIPPLVIDIGTAILGQDWFLDPEKLEPFLDDYPELRIKVTRGTRGQEYAGKGR